METPSPLARAPSISSNIPCLQLSDGSAKIYQSSTHDCDGATFGSTAEMKIVLDIVILL